MKQQLAQKSLFKPNSISQKLHDQIECEQNMCEELFHPCVELNPNPAEINHFLRKWRFCSLEHMDGSSAFWKGFMQYYNFRTSYIRRFKLNL